MTSPMPEFVEHVIGLRPGESVHDLLLDHTKISWYKDRVQAWERGERIAPITMDVAWTRQCQAACVFCAASTQANENVGKITKKIAFDFLDDAAEIGVKGISLISDGESTVVPWYEDSIEHAAKLGIKIGIGSNGVRLKREVLERILPNISYLRFNFSAGNRDRYSQIMGLKGRDYDRVVQNVKDAMEIKRRDKLPVNINMQMVVAPHLNGDEIMPFANLCAELRPDYGIMKHCADDSVGTLGVNYKDYETLHDTFKRAEALGDDEFRMVMKWSRIENEGKRQYNRCYGMPFLLQISGSGLVASCGPMFNDKFSKFHIGNIIHTRFKEIWQSERYWEVVDYLANNLDPSLSCPPNCLQTNTNQWLWDYKQGKVSFNEGPKPAHSEFL